MKNDDTRALKDKDEIERVLVAYCRAADAPDEALMRTVFHPDATDEHAGMLSGSMQDLIPAMMEMRKHLNGTHHAITNISIKLDGDAADTECYVSAFQGFLKDGQQYQWFCGGRYVDRFERRNGEWRIAKRAAYMDWSRIVRLDPSIPQPF